MSSLQNLKLYEIDAEIESLIYEIEAYEDLEKEVPIDLKQQLDDLNLAKEIKVKNIARFYKNLTSDAEKIKKEEDVLKKRRQRAEKYAGYLYDYLASILNEGEIFQDEAIKITWKKKQDKLYILKHVEVFNEETGVLEPQEILIDPEDLDSEFLEKKLNQEPESEIKNFVKTEFKLKLADLKASIKSGSVFDFAKIQTINEKKMEIK